MALLKKVTMQDIADACNLSRNTVSKVFNSRGDVPEATKELVLSKALELGYISSREPSISALPAQTGNIALLTHSKPTNHNFGSLFITNFTDQICRSGYNLKVFEISNIEYTSKSLPDHFLVDDISGIIVIELFDRDYIAMICELGVPVLLIDGYVDARSSIMECDMVFMENFASTSAMTKQMIQAGAKSIGFVGDMEHCSSFNERWLGYVSSLSSSDIELDKRVCILEDDSKPYGEVDWLITKLREMPYIPDGFVCANDFIAIRMIQALKRLGISVPSMVMISGFDGTPEAEVIDPPLTTASIPSAEIGRISANLLLERIATPSLPYRYTCIQTTPIWRHSIR